MCLDIAFYSALELIDDSFPGLLHDDHFSLDPATADHIFALGYKRYPVIVQQGERLHLKIFEWGVIAEYMNSPEKIRDLRKTMVNARSEKILDDKRSFWHRIRRERCLVPVTGIYEHREVKGWKNKIPYHIRLSGRPVFFLPALYHYNQSLPSDPETGEVRGMFSLVTRPANELMNMIHNSGPNAGRMPLFLPPQLERQWLDPALSDTGLADLLRYEIPSTVLEAYPVYSIRGRSPRPDGKRKNEPFPYAGLPAPGTEGESGQASLF